MRVVVFQERPEKNQNVWFLFLHFLQERREGRVGEFVGGGEGTGGKLSVKGFVSARNMILH
jgi:hypothetical protein